jgi:2-polyprenyl-3-methyl-5-hydroxy-6-metoxy-1,4-benzoquinol methylase
MRNEAATYDNAFYPDNVYGHALELVCRHVQAVEFPDDAIHLDIGCGYGRIAEPLVQRLGLKYVGVDVDKVAIDALKARGLEAHELELSGYSRTVEALSAAIDGRRVASVSMLDTLEHLHDGDEVLLAIREIIGAHKAVAVLSVPNVAHRDIGFRLAFGAWDYTSEGLLDYTHTRLFNASTLSAVFRHAGLHPIDGLHVEISDSDQHFPPTHPALVRGSLLSDFLRQIRGRIDSFDTTNQFVFACTAGPHAERMPFRASLPNKPSPFLSIITRTQGTRIHTLVEAFTALAAQSDRDFEVIVVGHRLVEQNRKAVERAIEDTPEWLRTRTRLVREERGNRTKPLNTGFQHALGDYIAILDDDDVPFGHWVETFKKLAAKRPGALLRTVATQQTVTNVEIGSHKGVRAESSPQNFVSDFDLFEHLRMNATPPIAVAFPRGPFHDFNIRFDESLTTTEDWDYILRVALLVGVESTDEVTCLYHWWDDGHQSSRTDHLQSEWKANHELIWQKLDRLPLLLGNGSAGRIRALLDERDGLKAELGRVSANAGSQVEGTKNEILPMVYAKDERIRLLREIASILESTSWKITSPLRWVAHMLGSSKAVTMVQCFEMPTVELYRVRGLLTQSTSWRLSAPIRKIKQRRR